MKLKKKIPLIDQHDKNGFWGGKFGGSFIPETLKKPVEDLTIEFQKLRNNKKIITALTIETEEDVKNYKIYNDLTDIYLFDSKGYEKSKSFDHSLIKNINLNKEIMLAGNIQVNDNLEKYQEIADIIDISGGLETSGLKDISKIETFLNKFKNIKNETQKKNSPDRPT